MFDKPLAWSMACLGCALLLVVVDTQVMSYAGVAIEKTQCNLSGGESQG